MFNRKINKIVNNKNKNIKKIKMLEETASKIHIINTHKNINKISLMKKIKIH